ncbi:hypothetical protein ACRALDRAFT_208019 [Sodiomyces alcalophilus JCM 7366]|uniref:uncharacterized protein n=1 Tax=Sodiomyces alcalophilus JCM 7366 TaxID=591952 RepID=UPI0039B41A68
MGRFGMEIVTGIVEIIHQPRDSFQGKESLQRNARSTGAAPGVFEAVPVQPYWGLGISSAARKGRETWGTCWETTIQISAFASSEAKLIGDYGFWKPAAVRNRNASTYHLPARPLNSHDINGDSPAQATVGGFSLVT